MLSQYLLNNLKVYGNARYDLVSETFNEVQAGIKYFPLSNLIFTGRVLPELSHLRHHLDLFGICRERVPGRGVSGRLHLQRHGVGQWRLQPAGLRRRRRRQRLPGRRRPAPDRSPQGQRGVR